MKKRASFPKLHLLALLAFLLAGCVTNRAPATARYQSSRNETVFRTRTIGLGTLFESEGFGQDPRVVLNGWARCPGEHCHPNEAWLSFSLRRSAKEMQIVSDRSVTIATDREVYSWQQEDVAGSRAPTHGEIARISLDMSTLEDIATTQRFRGTIGGEEFSLSREEREPLRALYKKVSGEK